MILSVCCLDEQQSIISLENFLSANAWATESETLGFGGQDFGLTSGPGDSGAY